MSDSSNSLNITNGGNLNMPSISTLSNSSTSTHSNASSISSPTVNLKKAKRGPRGGVYDPFPMKLHRMLNQSDESIVGWLEHGRAFKIHKPNQFAEVIMPNFFNQSKYQSFQRQLNLYGFNRTNRGAYFHELFLRSKPSLATRMLRQKIKGCRRKTMKLSCQEPDFYSMPPLTHDQQGDGLVPSIFPLNSRQYLPITAISSAYSASVSDSDADSHQNHAPSMTTDRSLTSTDESASFVKELNEHIFLHGCTILCQLRRSDSDL